MSRLIRILFTIMIIILFIIIIFIITSEDYLHHHHHHSHIHHHDHHRYLHQPNVVIFIAAIRFSLSSSSQLLQAHCHNHHHHNHKWLSDYSSCHCRYNKTPRSIFIIVFISSSINLSSSSLLLLEMTDITTMTIRASGKIFQIKNRQTPQTSYQPARAGLVPAALHLIS